MAAPAVAALHASVKAAISAAGSPAVAAQKAAYFKHVGSFLGVASPQLAGIVEQTVVVPVRQAAWPPAAIRELMCACVRDEHMEVKQAGCLVAWRLKKPLLLQAGALVDATEGLFDGGHVYDWATCDTLCGRVLFECVKAEPSLAQRVAAWKDSPLTWKQRAAAVTFVKLAGKSCDLHDTILSVCGTIVQSPERFVQLGCGWVLREAGVRDQPRVVAFIKDRYASFSREGLRYAIEKMPPPLRAELLAYRAPVPASSSPVASTLTSGGAAASGKRKRG